MAETTNNKIVRLETQMSNVETKVDEVKVEVRNMSAKLDSITDLRQELQALRDAHAEHVRITEQEIRDIRISNEKEIREIKSKNMLKGWLYPTMSAVIGSIMTFLIIEFLRTR